MLLGRTLRAIVRRHAPQRAKPYLLDAVTAFQMMACSLENSQIMKYYGHGAYLATLVILVIWYEHTLGDTSGNPCSHVIRYARHKISLIQFLLHVACQLTGGLLSYRFARLFWSLELYEGHVTRYRELYCTTALNVPVLTGFGIEFSATMFDTFLSLITFTPFYVFEMLTKSFVGCLLVVLGKLSY